MKKYYFVISLISLVLAALLVRNLAPKDQAAASVDVPVDKVIVAAKTTVKEEVKKIKRIVLSSNQVVYLHGAIDANSAKEVVRELKLKSKTNKKVYLLIDSPGGLVSSGGIILSAMESSQAKINTVCMGMCASMAFIIHQYGHTRYAIDRAILMAHPASSTMSGTLEQIHARLSTMNRYVDKMNTHVAKRLGMSLEQFKTLIANELWLDSEDALRGRYVDSLVDVENISWPEFMDQEDPETDEMEIVW